MLSYILQRLLLLPITLFFILLVNFVIINLAPGDPIQVLKINPEGGVRHDDKSMAFGSDEEYLVFREFYGLTLPILFNTWPWTTQSQIDLTLWQLVNRKSGPESTEPMSIKDYEALRTNMGDRAKFVMPLLLHAIQDSKESLEIRKMAVRFFVRGATRQGYVGSQLTQEEKKSNREISQDNLVVQNFIVTSDSELNTKVNEITKWYEENKVANQFEPNTIQKVKILFFQTRFFKYMSRVVTLNFGSLRNDANKSVISEVTKRFKYSLTLSILPMIITFALCQLFGFMMALNQNRSPDYLLNLFFLVLYAVPIFVVAPFLIEKVALNHYFPFTHIPIPISGFTSPDEIYSWQTSKQRLFDVIEHIVLPIVAVMYGGLAAQSRLSRTAILEVMHQDYVRTARAKGVPPIPLYVKHVGRNAGITIVTAIAGSLGIILSGSLIVEILFDINGFGKFFYDAVINRDYNVILFSTLAGSFLTLVGYIAADITYTILDPRLTIYQVTE